ncbi:diguanylate cyclase (GGDEF)-like protein [Amycolatopsis jiangsuensis]|uniref:Diguanylate cyclase (GGDEF)-like protein n=2 Tax=Amycolatopsis jiangsuensis TaxID=1181879 RepID=A0A840IWU3_9PSEU|nr:GGDEF domain-containing protein [Amycolatopsis jiangsuensis]MBB4685374.1 diguanylate cyclase (GGDEF)-like protein [Amycolatopsis jiangsuensis]
MQSGGGRAVRAAVTSWRGWPGRWAMWMVARRRWIGYAVGCEVLAAAVTVAGLMTGFGGAVRPVWFGALVAVGIAQAEMSRRIERLRRWMSGQTHINVTSVWYLAGAVLLPPAWVALLALVLYLHLWLRVWRNVRTRPAHRFAASTGWAMLSCFAASAVLAVTGLNDVGIDSWYGLCALVLAAAVFEVVNAGLVAIGIFLYTNSRSSADLVGTWEDNAFELATLCLGGLTALALVWQPVLVVFVLPPLLLLHRYLLLKQQLQVAAVTDEKTGLLNTAGWHDLATREFTRARRRGEGSEFAVLMIDLDHFKRINDTYGHLTGDEVLAAVAVTIEGSLRQSDTVGRFGGEEFVVLLPATGATHVLGIAERVRSAVGEMTVAVNGSVRISGLSVSVGVARYPAAGETLDEVLRTADAALYRAKDSGRNCVSV